MTFQRSELVGERKGTLKDTENGWHSTKDWAAYKGDRKIKGRACLLLPACPRRKLASVWGMNVCEGHFLSGNSLWNILNSSAL